MRSKTMPQSADKQTPPYLPYKTFRNFIEGLRGGVPGRIDRTVMPRYSGAVQSMLLGALRYLKLTNPDGSPKPLLTKLAEAESGDRQTLLRDMLRAAYSFMFNGSINLQNATSKQVQEAFAGAGVSGDTVRKAVAFFLAAAKDADIPLSPYLKVRELVRTLARRRGVNKANGGGEKQGGRLGERPAGSQSTPYEMLINILDPGAMDEEEQKAVWTLIRYLKKREGE